jgi:hypothetical protein
MDGVGVLTCMYLYMNLNRKWELDRKKFFFSRKI